MKLATENYKGIAIRCVKNVLGSGKPVVKASWFMKGKTWTVEGNTKDYVITEAKKRIDKIL